MSDVWSFQYENGIKVGILDFNGDILIYEEKSDGYKTGNVGINREEAIAAARAILKHFDVK